MRLQSDRRRPGRENRAATNQHATNRTAQQTPPRPAPTPATTAPTDTTERTHGGHAPTPAPPPPSGTAAPAPSPTATAARHDTRPRAPQAATPAATAWPAETSPTQAQETEPAQPTETTAERSRADQPATTQTRKRGTSWQKKHPWQTSAGNRQATGRPTDTRTDGGARAKEPFMETALRIRLVARTSCKHGLSTPRVCWPVRWSLRGGYDVRPGPEAGALGWMGRW
jgi:hypothetical protein